MATVASTETMTAHIVRAIQVAADDIRENAICDAVSAFEKELRESVLKSAINLTEFYDISRQAENLVITVRHSKETK